MTRDPAARFTVWEGAGQAILVDTWVLWRPVEWQRHGQRRREVLPRLWAYCDRLNERNARALA